MGWNRLKLILAAFLTVANVVLALYMQNMTRTSDYIPAEELRQLFEILRADGITVAEDSVSAKKSELVIYEGRLGETYYASAAKRLSSSEVALSFNTPDGFVLTMEDGDRYVLSDNFSVRYDRKDAPEFLSVSAIDWDALNPLENAAGRSVERAVTAYLNAYKRGRSEPQSFFLTHTALRIAEDPETGIRYCLQVQCARGTEISEFQTLFAVQNGEVIGASGKWCFAEITSSYDAQLVDQVNILYSVKNIIDEKRSAGISDPAGILSVSLGYAAYFRADTDIFYLIPTWIVETDDGESMTLNAVDGSLRTE